MSAAPQPRVGFIGLGALGAPMAHNLLQAGLPLDRALGLLADLAPDGPFAELLENVRHRVKGGATLADAVAAQGSVFSRF